jgi:WS/DGAT/MGAT family acyltransferase
MSGFAYARLSELDRSFLVYEGPASPMHVGAVQVFEAAPLRNDDGVLDFERILALVESRLHRLPRYRQHVVAAPVDGHPIWVDAPRFNVRYHVRHTRLPRPGDERQLKRTTARLLEQPLDLAKPPWELWVVEGLEGDRVALVSKVHHCMVDGVSGVDLMALLLSTEPQEVVEEAARWIPRRGPSALEYLTQETAALMRAPAGLARHAWELLTDAGGARHAMVERLSAAARLLSNALVPAPPTPLNRPIGPHRRFDWTTTSLDDVKRVRERLGGTVNDVVLATVAGALRRFLKDVRTTDVDDLVLRVMAPVSVRSAEERGALGNRVAAWIVPLPVGERDPVARLARVCETTSALKQRHETWGAEVITQVLEWVGATPLAATGRLLQIAQPFHLVVTNVPGPPFPLYLLGARMLEAHPMVPLLGTLSVGIALFSYQRTLSWGFTADWDLVPDLHELVVATQESFAQLLARAEATHPATAEPRGRRRKAVSARRGAAAERAG